MFSWSNKSNNVCGNGSCSGNEYTPPLPPTNEFNRIVLFYKPGCPHSMRALETVKKIRINNKSILYNAYNSSELMKLHRIRSPQQFGHTIGLRNGYATFPMIFINGSFIGGNAELQQMINN